MFISLRPSLMLVTLLSVMHGISLVGTMFVPVGWPLKIFLGTILMVNLAYYLRRHALLWADNSIVEIELKSDCTCGIRSLSGAWQYGSLLPTTFITRNLVVLNLALSDSRRFKAVAILADAIDAQRFRELRVLLKWKCGKALVRAAKPY